MKTSLDIDRVSLDAVLHVLLIIAGVAALGFVCVVGDVLTVLA